MPLKSSTIIRLAKKRGWFIHHRSNQNLDFISPPKKLEHWHTLGYMRIEDSPHHLKWEDARMSDQENIHLNSYYSWPENVSMCLKMFAQIEMLVNKYILPKETKNEIHPM